MLEILTQHRGTAQGLAGGTLALFLEHVTPYLTLVVLVLTIVSLVLEIRKKLKKED